jgi:hypothetical protein
MANGPELPGFAEYHELTTHATPKGDGTFTYNTPSYQDIPRMDNTKFIGYWQSFEYFDSERDYILEKFNLPYQKKEGCVGLHFRRGDFLQLTDKHPEIPIEYYRKAIRYFADKGYEDFIVFSDDMKWCEENLTHLLPKDINLLFSNATSELDDLISLSGCEHQILCYSTFGFVAAYLNRNPNKQIIIPPKDYVFSGANANFIHSSFIQLDF